MDGLQRIKGEAVLATDAADECMRDGMRLAGEVGPWGASNERGGGRVEEGGRGDGHHAGRGSDSEHTLSGHTSPPCRPMRLLLDSDSGTVSVRRGDELGSRCGLLDYGSETNSGSCSGRRSRGSGSGSRVGGGDGGSAAEGTGSGGSGGTGGGRTSSGVLCSLSPLALPPPPPLLPYGDSRALCDSAARLGGDTSSLRDLLQSPPRPLSTMGIGSPLGLDMDVPGGMSSLGEMGGTFGGVGGLAPLGQLASMGGMSSMGGMGGIGGMGGMGGIGGMGGLGGLNGMGGLGLADLGGMGGLGGMGASMGMALGLSAEMGLPRGFSFAVANPPRGGAASDQAAGDTDAAMGLGALSVDTAMGMDLMDDRPPVANVQGPRAVAVAGVNPHAVAPAVNKTPSGGGALAVGTEGAIGRGARRGNLDNLVVGATTAGVAAGGCASPQVTQTRPKGANPRQRRDAARAKASSPTRRADSRLSQGESRKLPPPKAEYRCTFEGCSKTFARRYNRVVHSRK